MHAPVLTSVSYEDDVISVRLQQAVTSADVTEVGSALISRILNPNLIPHR